MTEQAWTIADLRGAVERYEAMLRVSDVSRNTLNRYVEFSERFVNWLDGSYTPRVNRRGHPYGGRVLRSKYDPLRDYLSHYPHNAAHMTFRQIEQVIGQRLPPSARLHAHWWTNDGTGRHVQASAWLAAGRRARQLNILNQTVMFVSADRDARSARGVRAD